MRRIKATKVIRIGIDKDIEGWRPEKAKLDIDGNEIEDCLYNTREYDRTLIIEVQTTLVAKKFVNF